MSTPSPNPSLRPLRHISILEGISYLILLGIAMPLKYYAGLPLAVRICGIAHGGLCILLLYAIFKAWENHRISTRTAIETFIASLIPFGAFWMDRQLRQIDRTPPPDRATH